MLKSSKMVLTCRAPLLDRSTDISDPNTKVYCNRSAGQLSNVRVFMLVYCETTLATKQPLAEGHSGIFISKFHLFILRLSALLQVTFCACGLIFVVVVSSTRWRVTRGEIGIVALYGVTCTPRIHWKQ